MSGSADPRRRTLLLLALAALLGVLLAALALHEQSRQGASSYRPVSVLPGFAARVRDAANIQILTRKDNLEVAFVPDKGWVLPQHGGYPAAFSTVRSTLIGLAGLETIEPKTARPDWLAYVNLDMPPKGGGTLITVRDDKDHVLASLITGMNQDIGDPSGATGLYVRKPGENQSYLARTVLVPQGDPAVWFDKDVMNVEQARIAEVDVEPVKGVAYKVARPAPSQTDFALDPMPKGRTLANPSAADGIAAAIVGFDFADVQPARDLDFSRPSRIVTRTFDGLEVTLDAVEKDGDTWVTIAANPVASAPKIVQEARAINQHTSGWAYKLTASDGQLLATSRDSLLNPLLNQTAAPAKMP